MCTRDEVVNLRLVLLKVRVNVFLVQQSSTLGLGEDEVEEEE